jgi:hypothetical protein
MHWHGIGIGILDMGVRLIWSLRSSRGKTQEETTSPADIRFNGTRASGRRTGKDDLKMTSMNKGPRGLWGSAGIVGEPSKDPGGS